MILIILLLNLLRKLTVINNYGSRFGCLFEIYMSDFTKYELQSLLWAIEYVRERTNNGGDVMRRLERDINYMIDNYCEHQCHEWGVGFEPIHSPVVYCKRCNCQKPILPRDVF
jgi:hypothetical protein